MVYGYPIWPKEKYPAWLVYLVVIFISLFFVWISSEDKPNANPPMQGNEWIER